MTKITDHLNNEFTFTYDTLSRKTAQSDPDMGSWTYGYDGAGNLTSQTDNRNITTTRTYDELNRVTLLNYPNDTDSSFAYDLGKIGTLHIATDSAGTVNYSYDNRLRKTQEQRTINGTTKATSFTYDALDRLATTTYPDGEVITNSFNNQGEINSATGSAGLVSDIDYNALGKITKKDFANGLSTNYTYSTNNFRLNRIHTGSLQDLNYEYDLVGNVASILDSISSKTQNFTYDDLDRLKTATESAGYNYAYEYNPIGNLTKFTDNGTDIDYTYGENDKPHALTSSNELIHSTTLQPTEDTYVDASLQSTNFGSSTGLGVDGDPVKISYLKFDLSEFTGAQINQAKLRLYVTNESLDSQLLKRVDTNSWSEGSMTYANKPVLTNETIATIADASSPNTWIEIDITSTASLYKGQVFSLGIESTGADGLGFNSSESSSNSPELVIAYAGNTEQEISATTVLAGNSASSSSSVNTASVSPVANKLYLLSVTSRTDISTNPNQPTVSGAGLTWVAVNSVVYDTSSSTRRRVTVFRALGASPTSGALTINFSGQTQTNTTWMLDEFSGVDTSGTNGSGAVVQSATNKDETGSATSLTVSLSAFGSTSNATYGTFATDGNDTFTQGSGFTLFDQEASGTSLASATEWKNMNDTSVDASVAVGGGLGGIAIEIKAGTGSQLNEVSSTNITSGINASSVSSANTASVSPSANKLYLLSVVSRTNISTNPNQPSITGNNLTWVAVNSVVYDTSGGTRRRVTTFRAMGASPSAGSVTIDFSGQTQTDIAWTLDEFTGIDTSGTNGSGAIVQSATNYTDSGTALTVTLSSFGSTANATYGAFGNDAEEYTQGSGFTKLAEGGTTSNGVMALSQFKSTNDTSVDVSVGAADQIGGIAIELKAEEESGSGIEYTYDANGNMTSDGTKCYEYNEANQLKKVKWCSGEETIAEYVYDYNGMRMVKKNYSYGALMNTVYSWSDSFETRVIVGGGTESTSYYFINNELVAKKDNNGTRTYFHNDHLGSTTVITDASGSLAESTKYDPWGEVRSGGAASKFLYTGQERDSETGLHYYNARYYDPHIRRFTQPDDIIQNAFDPQTLNRYSYVRNNPLRYTDPSGHINILSYNTALTQYHKNPSALSYNNVLGVISQFASAPNSSSTSRTIQSNSSNNSQSKADKRPPNILTLKQNMKEAENHKINAFAPSVVNQYNTLWFANRVRPGGEWDYRKKFGDDYENFGNFNYGLTGRAAGYSTYTLQSMAGVAQQIRGVQNTIVKDPEIKTAGIPFFVYPYGDAIKSDGSSSDQIWIVKGAINYSSPW